VDNYNQNTNGLINTDQEKLQRTDELQRLIGQHEQFWSVKLSALNAATVPFANSISGQHSARHKNKQMPIPCELLTFLKRQPEMRMETIIFAAFGSLMARLSGLESFDLGYEDSKRQAEIAGSVELFATQVPLHFEIDFRQSFSEILEVIHEEIKLVKAHKTYARDIGNRFPLLDSQSEPDRDLVLPVSLASTENPESYQPVCGSQLTLAVSEHQSECRWIYDENKIEPEHIDKLICHFNTFLKGILADPDCHIAYLPLLSDGEHQKLLFELNDNGVDYHIAKSVHELFEARAIETPEAAALIFNRQILTYQELNKRANQLARYLRKEGVGAGVLVGIYVERSLAMAIGILGILKAGGAYLPLDPAYPKERLEFMLADSQASVLLTEEKLVTGLSHHATQIICFDSHAGQIAKESAENPESLTTTDKLAYVIYTSGSTGRPKGVMITHGNLVNYVQVLPVAIDLNADDRYLHTASISFSSSVRQLMLPLSNGAAVVIASSEQIADPLSLLEFVKEQNATVLDFVPSYWLSCLYALDSMPAEKARDLLKNNVRLILSASEPLPSDVPRRLAKKFAPEVRMINMFGQTETTGIISVYPIKNPSALKSINVPIGRPISNTQAYILDQYQQPVPFGLPGELYLGGAAIGQGYLNRPEFTAEQFIENSFKGGLNGRLYRTGDLVRYLPGGEIEHLGRIDNQVKIRGFRVELGEIEATVLKHPAVKQCVVLAREQRSGNKSLAAFIVRNHGLSVDEAELRSYLKRLLPDYMLPASFIDLESLPLTPNGKIDRKALLAPDLHVLPVKRNFAAPRTITERKLAEIWQKTLGISAIGIGDNFFEIGGDSLQAVSLMVDIEEALGRNLPLAVLIDSPTIEKMAEAIDAQNTSDRLKYLVTIKSGNARRAPLFCMHAAGGNVLFYRDLAKELDPLQPVYGLQARGVADKSETAHERIEDMAVEYLEEMRAVQPSGPYNLCGSSFGGLIAFEIACRLAANGEEVSLLALFDTYAPGYLEIKPNSSSFQNKILPFLESALRLHEQISLIETRRAKINFLREKLQKLRVRAQRKKNWKRNQFDFAYAQATGRELPANIQRNHRAIQTALKNYSPPVYNGQITLFRAVRQPSDVTFEPTLGWKNFTTREILIREVLGSHGALTVYPYAKYLAEELSPFLKEKQALTEIASFATV
jgi:amino acid adenylation domain-containing protein